VAAGVPTSRRLGRAAAAARAFGLACKVLSGGRLVRAAGRQIRGRAGGAGGTRPAGPGWPRRGADRPHGSGGGAGSPRCRPRASPPPPHAAVPPRPEQRVLSALRRSVALARGGIVVRGIVAVDAPSPSPLRHHGEAPRRGGGSVGAAQGGCAGGFFCGLSVTHLAPPTGPSPPLQPAVVGRSLGCGNHRATASAGRGRGAVSQGGRGAGRRAGGTTGGGTQGGGLRQAPGEGRRGASAGRGAGAGRGRRCAQAQGPGGGVHRFRRRILPRPTPHRARTRTRPPARPTTRAGALAHPLGVPRTPAQPPAPSPAQTPRTAHARARDGRRGVGRERGDRCRCRCPAAVAGLAGAAGGHARRPGRGEGGAARRPPPSPRWRRRGRGGRAAGQRPGGGRRHVGFELGVEVDVRGAAVRVAGLGVCCFPRGSQGAGPIQKPTSTEWPMRPRPKRPCGRNLVSGLGLANRRPTRPDVRGVWLYASPPTDARCDGGWCQRRKQGAQQHGQATEGRRGAGAGELRPL
jgi:hypothetical protein